MLDLLDLARQKLVIIEDRTPDRKLPVKNCPSIQYVSTQEGLIKHLKEICPIKSTLAVDIETYRATGFEEDPLGGLDPYRSEIRLVQFYGGGDTVFVFDVKKLGGIEALGSEIWKRPMVAHNVLFELKHFIKNGVHPRQVGCTMLLANALYGGKLRSLKDLAHEVLGEELSKELQTSDWSQETLSQEQLEYAAKDAFVTFKLFHTLHPKLKAHNLERTYNLMRDAQHGIAQLELIGVRIDVEEHRKLIASWEQQWEKQEFSLREILGEEINLNSPQQLGAYIKTQVDVTDWPTRETGHLRVDAFTLTQNRYLPIAEPLLKYREMEKLLNTYGPSFSEHINPVTGRIHASFRLGGTATGRLSCYKPNLQNPPRDPAFRRLFVAEEGNVLVVADFSQIELRVAALVSQDNEMLEAYRCGEDLHRKTAASIMGIPQSEVTKTQRQMAKAVNFGLLFGMSAKGLASYAKQSYGVEMSLEEAKQAREAFFKTYKGLANWQRSTGRISKALGRVETPLGRVRNFQSETRGYRYTEALNTPVQAGAAEIMLCSLVRLEKLLDWKEASIVNVVHDEFIIECFENRGEEIKALVEDAMLKGFLDVFSEAKQFTKDLVEAKIAYNWGDGK